MADGKMHFTFEVNVDTLPGEVVGLTGDIEELGSWNYQNSIFLRPKSSQSAAVAVSGVWRCEVSIPKKSSLKYRYFTCIFPDSSMDTRNVIISRCETNCEPRVWVQSDDVKICDTFGCFDGKKDCISRGWLTTQTEVNIRLIPGCISLWNEDLQILSIKCTPFEMGREKQQQAIQSWSKVLTYTFNKNDYIPTLQKEGSPFHPNDVMMFKIQVLNTENLGFKFDFYGSSSKCGKSSTSENHIGYSCILISGSKDSFGKMTAFITSEDQKMQGEITVKYSIIKPLAGYQCSMNVSTPKSLHYEKYPIHIGHRGMGSSFDMKATLMENTIASFNAVGQYGAKGVEMDVHLTKDLVPVIYHDFKVHVAMEMKNCDTAANNHACISIKNLDLDQLQTLKLYHPSADKKLFSICGGKTRHEMPFPTLLDCLNEVQEDIGFSVELKYPSEIGNGEYEDSTMYDANFFCDLILSCILKHCGNRQIVLSCFEPDLCVMLNLKQNKFPVMFLTQGETKTWPPYYDLRSQTVEAGIDFAKAEGLYGICALSEILLKNEKLIRMCQEKNVQLLCWGNDNDNHDNLKFLGERGVTGLIHNQMDIYGPGAAMKKV